MILQQGFQKIKSSFFQDLVTQYKTHLEPNFVGINLPAYFGGITLQNKSLEQLDICEVLSYLKGKTALDTLDILLDTLDTRNVYETLKILCFFVCIFLRRINSFFVKVLI